MLPRLTLTVLLFSTSAVLAHHGTAASYDQIKLVKMEGTVIEFLWRNPHSSLFLKGQDAAGNPIEYSIELGSPAQMVKAGYTRNVFKPGDHAVLNLHPSRTNPASGECLTCEFTVNGKNPAAPTK